MFNILSLERPVHSVEKAWHRKALGCPNLGPNIVTKWLIFLFCVNKCPGVILCCLLSLMVRDRKKTSTEKSVFTTGVIALPLTIEF